MQHISENNSNTTYKFVFFSISFNSNMKIYISIYRTYLL